MRTDMFHEDYNYRPPTHGGGLYYYTHTHNWEECGAQINPNGTHNSLWRCTICTDIAVGGRVGPIPPGFCRRCGWVQQKKWPRKRCEDCKAPLEESA